MSQLVSDIVSRAAWTVDDELFRIIKQPEMISSLDRVYRDYCRRTKILRNEVAFNGNGGTDYQLYGNITGGSGTFGDDLHRLFRVTFNGHICEENEFDNILQWRINKSVVDVVHPRPFAIQYFQKFRMIYFVDTVGTTDEVDLWYFQYPKIGTLVNLTDSILLDDQYTDDLVTGLAVIASKKMIRYYANPSHKDIEMVNYHQAEMVQLTADYNARRLEVARIVQGYGLDNTPLIANVTSPYTDPDNFEDLDYSDL